MRSLLVLSVLLAPAFALATSVGSLRDPRPGSAVIDVPGLLTPEDVRQINELAAEARAGGELVVAVVDTTDGVDARAYTTELFNRLRLDTQARNRGVLLLAAVDDRAAEIVVGDGYEAGVTRATDRVMEQVVIAHFKRSNPRGAMVEGARALVKQLVLAPAAAPPTELPAGEVPVHRASPPTEPSPAHSASYDSSASTHREPGNFAERHPIATGGGVGGLLLGLVLGVRRVLRNRPRTCQGCGQKMERLDEAADDAHLSQAEKTEERIGSVDYDVWVCLRCGHALKLRYGAFFTSYSKCRSCSAKTLKSTTTTLVAATEYSTGTARVDEECAHCSYRNSYTRTIPRRPKPSSSSSSSRSSGGSSSGRGSSGRW